MTKVESDDNETDYLSVIPTEILLQIFNYLEPRFIEEVLSSVCVRFKELINSGIIWKARMNLKWKYKYPSMPEGPDLDWKQACIEREEQFELWNNFEKNIVPQTLPSVHISTVNCIHPLERSNCFLTGSRDRSIVLWDLNHLGTDQVKVHHRKDCHRGWIWCLESNDEFIFSGSFDNEIKQWDQETFTCISKFSLKLAVLSLALSDSLLYIGTFKYLTLKDIRQNTELDIKKFYNSKHNSAVLGLKIINGYHLISISEDHSLRVFDIRNHKAIAKRKFENYLTCLTCNYNRLYTGDTTGKIHLLNPSNLDMVKTWNDIHSSCLTSIHNSLGKIVTGSRDRFLKVLEPSTELSVIHQKETNEEISAVAVLGNNIVYNMSHDVVVLAPKI